MRFRLILPLYALLFLIFLYGPVLLMPVFSFNDNMFTTFPLKAFTFKHYAGLAYNSGMINALHNSLRVGFSVSIASTIVGLLAAIALTRYSLPGRAPITGMIMLPLVVPSVILGVALLVILRQVLDVELTLWTVGVGHLLLCVPFSMLVLVSRLEGFDRSLEEASADLGENQWMTFWRITFPLVLPGIIASLLMSFTISFDEFVLAFFLSGTEPTLPVYLFSQLRFPQRLPSTMALGSLILFVSALVIVISEILRQRGFEAAKPLRTAS
ncbi:MAG TPA: ABC transporter permease [Aestuariivirgaceae bacterium]|jgi:spermidine/putrescine transport system permease protein